MKTSFAVLLALLLVGCLPANRLQGDLTEATLISKKVSYTKGGTLRCLTYVTEGGGWVIDLSVSEEVYNSAVEFQKTTVILVTKPNKQTGE